MPSTASRSEFAMFEQNPAGPVLPRSYLAPPSGPATRVIWIFWNERELRAGWRLAIFAAIFFLLGRGATRLAALLHLPRLMGATITPGGAFAQECGLLLVTLAATWCMALLER